MPSIMPTGKQQFTNNAGVPLAGGRVYTFDAGTTTPKATYQDAAATVQNENPIVLNARGEALAFWQGAYDVKVTDANGVTIYTVSNYQAPVTPTDLSADTGANLVGGVWFDGAKAKVSDLGLDLGSSLIGFLQTGIGSVVRSIQDRLFDHVSALDFMTPAQRNSVRSGDGVADVTAAVQKAISAATCVRFPAGVYKMTGGLLQGAKKIILQGEGSATKFVLSGPLFAATQSDNEKNYQVTINDLELNSTAGYSYKIDYSYQSANQENGVKFNRVRFTGADGIFLQRTAGLQFNSCQWDRLTGTALYARLVVNLEVNGGLINACGIPFNVDGDSTKATETAGIAFNGTRIIGCGAGSIKYCDQPSMNNVLYDFNGTLTLTGNIGGRFSGYFGSASTHVINYTAGVIGSSLTGRFTHYNNGVTLKLNGPVRVHDSAFQDAFTHIYVIGTGAQITGNYFQKSAPNTRSIDADPGTSNVIVSDCIFEFLGSGCEAFPAIVPGSWQFSNNQGTELDTIRTTAIVPGTLTSVITNLAKKRAPKSAVCISVGFRLDWANESSFRVSAANNAPIGSDQAVTVSFSY